MAKVTKKVKVSYSKDDILSALKTGSCHGPVIRNAENVTIHASPENPEEYITIYYDEVEQSEFREPVESGYQLASREFAGKKFVWRGPKYHPNRNPYEQYYQGQRDAIQSIIDAGRKGIAFEDWLIKNCVSGPDDPLMKCIRYWTSLPTQEPEVADKKGYVEVYSMDRSQNWKLVVE